MVDKLGVVGDVSLLAALTVLCCGGFGFFGCLVPSCLDNCKEPVVLT
jgi:predicted metal-binding membrane protein